MRKPFVNCSWSALSRGDWDSITSICWAPVACHFLRDGREVPWPLVHDRVSSNCVSLPVILNCWRSLGLPRFFKQFLACIQIAHPWVASSASQTSNTGDEGVGCRVRSPRPGSFREMPRLAPCTYCPIVFSLQFQQSSARQHPTCQFQWIRWLAYSYRVVSVFSFGRCHSVRSWRD